MGLFGDCDINDAERAYSKEASYDQSMASWEISGGKEDFLREFENIWKMIKNGEVPSTSDIPDPDNKFGNENTWAEPICGKILGYMIGMLHFKHKEVLDNVDFFVSWFTVLSKDMSEEYEKLILKYVRKWVKFVEKHREITNGKERQYQILSELFR